MAEVVVGNVLRGYGRIQEMYDCTDRGTGERLRLFRARPGKNGQCWHALNSADTVEKERKA